MALKVHLHLTLILIIITASLIQNGFGKGLRMRVIGSSPGGFGSSGRKPWNSDRDRSTLYEQRFEDELMRMRKGDIDPKDFPCVGLCYYMKLQKMKNKEKEKDIKRDLTTTTPDPSVNATSERSFFLMLYDTEKPCVGLCYHFKKLGLPNPFPDHH